MSKTIDKEAFRKVHAFFREVNPNMGYRDHLFSLEKAFEYLEQDFERYPGPVIAWEFRDRENICIHINASLRLNKVIKELIIEEIESVFRHWKTTLNKKLFDMMEVSSLTKGVERKSGK